MKKIIALASVAVIGVLAFITINLFLKVKSRQRPLTVFHSDAADSLVGFYDWYKGPLPQNVKNAISIILQWQNNTDWKDDGRIKRALVTGNPIVLTVETWASTASDNVLKRVINGDFDDKINTLAGILSTAKQPLYLRFDPEMEVPVKKFPWQNQSPADYIAGFNYFAEKIKSGAPRVKMVWAPAGFPGDTEYWPGAQYTDMASITLGSASEKQYADNLISKTSIATMLREKMHRMRFVHQPVLIFANPLVKGYKPQLLSDAAANIVHNKAVIYNPDNATYLSLPKPEREQLTIGVYDPNARLLNTPYVNTEHIFTDWGEIEGGRLQKKFNEIINRHHDAIITVEPWRDTTVVADTNVLASTLKGRYDANIRKLYNIIGKTHQTVYLRFAHEMEIPIHRYAWQSQDAELYIKAYRYFMLFNKVIPQNIKRVWGPAGDRGSIDFYPGNDVVDFVSIAIYGLPDKNITEADKQEAFSTILARKYYRMRFLNKPIFITEFGVKGPENYQTAWMLDAAKTLNQNKHVFGVCYFNLYDNPKAWGNIKAPDWSITKTTFDKFYNELHYNRHN